MASRFFVHFLAVVARFLISRARFMELFLNCDMVLPGSTPENVANIWQIKWNWIIDKNWNSWNSLFKRRFRFVSRNFATSLAPRGFFTGTSVFPSPQKPTFPNSNSTGNQVDEEPLCGWATSKSLFIYLFIYLFILFNQLSSPFNKSIITSVIYKCSSCF